jgi:hypothetical protein
MKVKIRNLLFFAIACGFVVSCSLPETSGKSGKAQSKGSGNETIESMLVEAYSMLGYVSSLVGWESASSDYILGDIRGMIANKGAGPDDLPDVSQIQNFSETPSNSYLAAKWTEYYNAISACNKAISIVKRTGSGKRISSDLTDICLRQLRALRGWYHFEAWRIWNNIPYVDESSDAFSVSNRDDVRDKIIRDLMEGTALPNNMGSPGKFNGTVCQTLLAKAKMQMYHDYRGALVYLDLAKNGTKPDGSAIGLSPTFGEIFDIAKGNSLEDIYNVQYSVNDGSGGYKEGHGNVSGYAYRSREMPGDDCGFFSPTQEFVNSFRTSGGLPLLDGSYNNFPVRSDQGFAPEAPFTPDSGPLDPRIDWTVGRRGIPYWGWGKHLGSAWIYDQSYSGPWSPKKQVSKKSSGDQNAEVGKWTSGYRPSVYHMVRYADILLMIAECQIETGDLAGALRNINLVRARAANPAGFVMDGEHPAANYQISLYKSFTDSDYARKALRMERKLELGMEGQRWFDLERWGIELKEINRILTYERKMPWGQALYGAASATAQKMTLPIPQQEIDIAGGRLIQNK